MTFSEFLDKEPEPLRRSLRQLLAGFSDTAQVNLVRVAAGESILRQGEPRGDIYILISGRVLNVVQQAHFSSYAFREYTPPEFFGEQEALAGIPTIIADVRAKTACRFLAISEADYLRWVQSDTQTMQKQVRTVLALLLEQAAHERAALFLNSDERIARFLADYYERHAGGGTKRKQTAAGASGITVRQGHAAIAEEIGVSPRTVNRCVQKLADAGTVGIHRGKMTLTQEQYEALKATIQN